ncbi:MAG TPA: hypothetical protein VMI56_13250 [Reyranella sp.]|nr:hypothetical protein [Reyranella sp.]
MTARTGRSRPSPWMNALVLVVTILAGVVAAECVVRFIDGQPQFVFPLPEPIGRGDVKPEELNAIALADGVDRSWFMSEPPPLPNRGEPRPGWQELFHFLENHPSGDTEFRPIDIYKVWNSRFAGDACKHRFLKHAPGWLYVYDPPDGMAIPPYRFYPDSTLPDWLVTNQIGWRGKPIEIPRHHRTVRIVFVGASTTIDAHHLPFSHPELVGHWLDMWAAAKHLDVHFETLNSGRESVVSTDIAHIVKTEVLPLRPDLVIYYEGGNQFRPESIVEKVPPGKPVAPPNTQARPAPQWMRTAARYSALMGRMVSAIGLTASDLDGREWPKPDYKVVWPPGLDEQDPDLDYPNLPVNLNTIEHDLDSIRSDLKTIGSEFALSSYIWMVKDGLVLDPVRHEFILNQLNIGNWPFRYRDLERLAKFQNRLYAKYARVHGVPFIDAAGQMPLDPDLFIDAVHTSYSGVRLHGWIILQQLIPIIEKHLADGSWPKPDAPDLPLPTFEPRKQTFDCAASK